VNNTAEREICESAWKKARLAAWVMLAAPALYVAVGLVLLKTRNLPHAVDLEERFRDILFYVLAGVAIVDFPVVTALRRATLSQRYVTRHFKSLGQVAQHYGHANILVGAVCQSPAVTGLVYFLLTGELKRMVILAGASVLFSLMLLPSRTKLRELLHAIQQQGRTRN